MLQTQDGSGHMDYPEPIGLNRLGGTLMTWDHGRPGIRLWIGIYGGSSQRAFVAHTQDKMAVEELLQAFLAELLSASAFSRISY